MAHFLVLQQIARGKNGQILYPHQAYTTARSNTKVFSARGVCDIGKAMYHQDAFWGAYQQSVRVSGYVAG